MKQDSSELGTVEAKKYAIALWALGLTRGVLYSMISGDVETEQVKKIFEATSLQKLAERFGYEESEMSVDWDELLSDTETFVYSGDEIEDTT